MPHIIYVVSKNVKKKLYEYQKWYQKVPFSPFLIIWSPNLEIIKAGLKLVVLLPDN